MGGTLKRIYKGNKNNTQKILNLKSHNIKYKKIIMMKENHFEKIQNIKKTQNLK